MQGCQSSHMNPYDRYPTSELFPYPILPVTLGKPKEETVEVPTKISRRCRRVVGEVRTVFPDQGHQVLYPQGLEGGGVKEERNPTIKDFHEERCVLATRPLSQAPTPFPFETLVYSNP